MPNNHIIDTHNTSAMELLIADVLSNDIAVIDTETNTLAVWYQEPCSVLVGFVVYFPQSDKNYYVCVRHGLGQLTDKHHDELSGVSYANTDKKLALGQLVYDEYFRDDVLATNITHEVWQQFKDIWNSNAHRYSIIMHNAPYDLSVFHNEGLAIPPKVLDTYVGAYCVSTDWSISVRMPDGSIERANRSLKWLGRLYDLPDATSGIDDLISKVNDLSQALSAKTKDYLKGQGIKHNGVTIPLKDRAHLWLLTGRDTATYALMDTTLTWGLYQKLRDRTNELGTFGTWELLCDVQSQTAFTMTRNGFHIDQEAAKYAIQVGHEQLQVLGDKIASYGITSPNSTQSIAAYLKTLGIETKSVDSAFIEKHKRNVPILSLIEQYRLIQKLLSNYVCKWADYGIIHPGFNVAKTVSYRWSSSDDFVGNLQNIPRDTGSEFSPKNLLLPPSGYMLIEADYKSLEIMVGAWVAETLLNHPDKTLTTLVVDDTDMHTYTSERVNVGGLLLKGDVNEANVIRYLQEHNAMPNQDTLDKYGGDIVKYFNKAHARQTAKIVNFSAMYGGGGRAIVDLLGIDRPIADEISKGWKQAYPAIPSAINTLMDLAMQSRDGECYVQYPLNIAKFIRRYNVYPTKTRSNTGGSYNMREAMAYKAFNHIVQGTAGLITVLSAHRINQLYSDKIVMLASVHDSIVMAIKSEDLSILYEVRRIMQDWHVYPNLIAEFDASPLGKAWGYKRAIDDLDVFVDSKGLVYG